MECLSIIEIDDQIYSYGPIKEEDLTAEDKRRWKILQEFQWGKIFLKYLNGDHGFNYEEICKDDFREEEGEDVVLRSKIATEEDVRIQLVHANEYYMDFSPTIKFGDISGEKIKEAAISKCKKYCERQIDTKNITLLIQGTDVSTQIKDLTGNSLFLDAFKNLRCFNRIYYITSVDTHRLK